MTPAHADPDDLVAAKARAKALAAQVEELQTKVEVAGERLAGAQDELATVVSQEVIANQQLAALSTAAQDSRAATNERVRALYMSGGQAGLYASVLDGGSLADVMARMDAVGRVLVRDRTAASADEAAVAEAVPPPGPAHRAVRAPDRARGHGPRRARTRSARCSRPGRTRSTGPERRCAGSPRSGRPRRPPRPPAGRRSPSASPDHVPPSSPPAGTVVGEALRAADRRARDARTSTPATDRTASTAAG